MRIYFTRHGESQANLLHEISNRGLRHGLTRKGREQAEGLARRLQGIPIAHIYSSPVLRAIETSMILAHRLDVDYEITAKVIHMSLWIFISAWFPASAPSLTKGVWLPLHISSIESSCSPYPLLH